MNPVSALRTLRDIATRRPLVVAAVGLGLLGEAGRVGAALARGGAVTLFGHGGGEVWDSGVDGAWVGAYVAWVAACGVTVTGLAIAGWRARRRGVNAAGVVTPASAAAMHTLHGHPSSASGVVAHRRRGEIKWPKRSGWRRT